MLTLLLIVWFLTIPRSARTDKPPRSSPEGPPSVLSRRALAYSVLAGLIAAFIACPSRYVVLRHWITPPSIQQLWWMPPIIVALEYVFIVLIAAFSGAFAGYGPHVHCEDPTTRRNLVLCTLVGMWTAPLMILLLERSELAGLIASGMVIGGYFVLGGIGDDKEVASSALREERMPAHGSLSRLEELSRFSKSLGLAIVASAALQAAGLANWIAERELALVLFISGALVLATQLPRNLVPSRKGGMLSRTGTRVILSTGCATAMVLVGLLPFISSSHADASLAALLRSLFVRKPGGAIVHGHRVRLQQTPIRSDGYIGVILTPKRQPALRSTKVPELVLNSRTPGLKNPLHIPFTGAYWFFQDPFIRPPFDSITAEGDPAKVGVRSSNRKPLQMEAVQSLEEPIDTRDLDKIELAILDADPNPGTISVELVLADTETWGRPMLSLGTERLNSNPFTRLTKTDSETQAFIVPVHSHLERFNQIRLIFRLDPSRDRQAAAIAINSFILVPRGL